MHELVYEVQLANLIFFVIILNDFLLLRRKSLRLECAGCDTSMRHAPNPSGLSKNSALMTTSLENFMILIKDRRFHRGDGKILHRRNRRDWGIEGVNRQPASISDNR
jgi:hypothetical protein